MRDSLRLLAVMVGSFALTIFLYRHQNNSVATWIGLGAIMLLIYIPFAFPNVGAFIANRPRAIFWVGIAMFAGSLALLLAMISAAAFLGFPNTVTGTDPMSVVMVWISLAGIAVSVLPRSMAALKRSEAVPAPLKTRPAAQSEFDGVAEAWIAIRTVIRDSAPLARLVGPWIVLVWAVPFIGLHIAAYKTGAAAGLLDLPTRKLDLPTVLLGVQLPGALASVVAFPIALVNWHRYIQAADSGIRLIPPAGATARYLWRLVMMASLFSVLVRLVVSNTHDVARLLGTSDDGFVAKLLLWSASCAAVYLGSSFAFVLPAVAMGNRNFLGADSVRLSKSLGNSFRLGFVLSLLPFGMMSWVITQSLDHVGINGFRLSLASYSLLLIPTAALFLALACCATYLSQIYAARFTAEPRSSAT